MPIDFQLGLPPNWQKSSRETKGNYYFDQTNQALGGAQAEANRLNTVEEGRGAEMERMLREAGDAANVPTMSERDINRGFGAAADTSGNAFKGGMDQILSMLGENGGTGGSGWSAGLAADLEGQRLGSLIGARRDLFTQKSTSDAMDRLKQYDRMGQLAQAVNRPVSMQNSDFLQMLTGIRLSQQQGQQNASAAKDAANATASAGWLSGLGQVGGALIGLAA